MTAATARIGVAQAERFPKITLTGLLGLASPQLSALGSGAFGSAGLALAAPLFNAQALGFQQQAAEALARQALAQYEQTVLVAFREVEDALVAVRTAREQTEAQEAQVASLRSALHLAEIRYKGGLSNYLDVLTAKRSLFDVELSLTATRRLRLVSIIQLYKALGSGWSPGYRRRPKQPSWQCPDCMPRARMLTAPIPRVRRPADAWRARGPRDQRRRGPG